MRPGVFGTLVQGVAPVLRFRRVGPDGVQSLIKGCAVLCPAFFGGTDRLFRNGSIIKCHNTNWFLKLLMILISLPLTPVGSPFPDLVSPTGFQLQCPVPQGCQPFLILTPNDIIGLCRYYKFAVILQMHIDSFFLLHSVVVKCNRQHKDGSSNRTTSFAVLLDQITATNRIYGLTSELATNWRNVRGHCTSYRFLVY